MSAAALDAALKAAGVPIDGVSPEMIEGKREWRVDFAVTATDEQRQTAQAIVDAFDPATVKPPVIVDPVAALEKRVAALEARAGK